MHNNLEQRIQNIQNNVKSIQQRNQRVEIDKAWETSGTRILAITIITYIIASIILYFIGIKNFLLNAIIPTIGYLLSTQSLSIIKKWWVKLRW